MHAFNRFLSVDGEKQLRDRRRLTAIFLRAYRFRLLAAGLCFAVGGFALLAGGVAFFEVVLPDSLMSSVAKTMLAACVVIAALLFPFLGARLLSEVVTDPIFLFLHRPHLVEVTSGVVKETGYYPFGGKRSLDRIMVVAELTNAVGEKWTIRQPHSARGWPFVEQSEEPTASALKGRRPTLPFPAFFIYLKQSPKHAALCGMPTEVFDRAQRFRRRAA